MNLIWISRLIRISRPPLLALLLSAAGSGAATLYETGFESFTPGADNLVGTDGWVATLTDQMVHGIDDEIIPGLGKSAFLGFAPPSIPASSRPIITVFRPLNYDPIKQDRPVIQFEAIIAIADSRDDDGTPGDESLRKDRFLISVYNMDGQLLASIIYDNRSSSFGLWRNDGIDSADTNFEFILEEPQFLFFRIDFGSNTWSAFLDGIPLFTEEVFNANGRSLTLGTIAAEWLISNRTAPGDNWMLFDDWIVEAKPRSTEPFEISQVKITAGGLVEITYPADEGFSYRIESSTDLTDWIELPNSPVTAQASDPAATHIDPDPAAGSRYYRITRDSGN